MRRRSIALFAAIVLVLAQVATTAARSAPTPAAGATEPAAAKVEKGLLDKLEKGDLDTFIVEFAATADLAPAKKIKDHGRRGEYVYDALRTTAATSQKEAKALVKATKGATATSYWITNVLAVEGDAKLAAKLAKLAGVTVLRAPKTYPLVKPVDTATAILQASGDPEWGIAKIGAPTAWDEGVFGQGIVVGSVDTGVDYLHPALVNQYRGNNGDGTFSHDYNWWDPTGLCGAEPCDTVGHGTHTMGTMVGGDGPGPFTPDIGVAPGARWIAAKGCEDLGCSEQALLSSGQFILAPTDLAGQNADPSRRPDVVNNSWGGGPGDTFYLETVQAWRAAGIIPVFSSGNPGPDCGQGGSPGDFPEVISVGATDSKDVIAEFSGRGPSVFDGKAWNPDIAAPGVDVVSSVPGGGYEAYSGTSMAAPHTSGEIALILSARPALVGDFDGVANAVRTTALDRIDEQCGAAPGGDPNNVYGDGRIDAAAAVTLVKTGGTLAGTVTSAADGTPIAGATLAANNGSREFRATTDVAGRYSIFLAAGDYGLDVRAFGFYGATAGSVTIVTDATTVQDFSLDLLPRFNVTGHVTAAEDGSPVADVTVAAVGVPVVPVTTDAAGAYTLTLPIGTYTLRFSAGGCTETATADVTSDGPDVAVDRALFRKLDNFGHGCAPIALDWVDATGQSALWGDEFAGRLRLPFAFDFYGTPYEQLWLSDNGYVNFLGPDQYNGFPSAIPSSGAPNAAIYALWQDLYLDAQSQVDYELVGTAPNRAFVVEFSGIRAYGTSGRFSFELKLWEDGTLDLLYGDNPANPGDGRNATVGIENATGTDAFQFAFFEPVVGRNAAYRFEVVPSGLLHGVVTDANDGEPIAGATVTASPGGRTATTAADGTYNLRLRPGSYAVTIARPPYQSASRNVTIVLDGDLTADAALTGGLGAVTPAAISATVDYGQTTTRTLSLANSGSAPLAWEAKERDLGTVLPPLPEPTVAVHRAPTWTRPIVPKSFPVTATTPSAGDLLPIIEDPAGDASGSVDVTTVSGGSDGRSTASLALEFTAGTPMSEVVGYVFLDTDQDPSTGDPPEFWNGLPAQDVGIEYIVDLWGIHDPDPVVYIVNTATYEVVAVVPATIDGQTVAFDMPLEALGNDDGFINAAMVVGSFNGPTDWAPDGGHGTITPFVDLAWLAEAPSSGSVPAAGAQEISLALGGATLEPGEYHGLLVLLTDGPKSRQISVPVDLTVTLPDAFGAITGTATAAHTGQPLAGVEVGADVTWQGSPLHLATTTAGDGTYRIVGPAGTWPATFALPGYLDATRDITIVRGVTTPNVDAALHKIQPHAVLDPDSATFVLTPGRTATRTLTLSNPEGHTLLSFTVNEVALDRGMAAATAGRARPTGIDPNARTTKGAAATAAPRVPPAIMGDGDVLSSWPTGMTLPWGVGYTGNIVLSDPADALVATFTPAGERLGQFASPWSGEEWGADMAYDAARNLVWQVHVGGDNGIYGIDPTDGSVKATITGSPWSSISQRGLAYDPVADEFYVGGWNEGILYRVAGPSHATPGETLGQCSPADPAISGLAWNLAFGLVWAATNSESDTIYLLDPATCETLRALPHPDGGGGGGAGLEVDAVGNLWTVGQNTQNAYLVESGLPVYSDVPWLTATPVEGAIAPDGSAAIEISVATTDLEPGVHRAIVVVGTNDPDHKMIQVPVVVVVPSFQQGVNAGGGGYTNANGDVFAPDRAYADGPFGFVGASSSRSTKSAIAGTTDVPLYQDLRLGMTGYRFAVPEGRYRVDLAFAEIVARKAGSRVFSVAIEGQAVLVNLDVFAEVGRDIALDRWFEVDVADGALDITFTAQRGDAPIVNAILVTEVPPGSPAW